MVEDANSTGTFMDLRDGQAYKTVEINGKNWFAENLNYFTSSGSAYYNNDVAYSEYGRLYNWNTARNSCPANWHLPSKDEWCDLIKSLDQTYDCSVKIGLTGNDAGKQLKEGGFMAKLGGFSWQIPYSNAFDEINELGGFWTSTSFSSEEAYYRSVSKTRDNVYNNYLKKYAGYSVRCVGD